MINITFKPKTLELEVTGHAGQNEKGKDIVCSAISALFYTLGQTLIDSAEMLEEAPIVKNEEGNGYICCSPKEEYEGNVATIYRTILIGMQMVAEEYKNFVKFTLGGVEITSNE
jgi:uncharacterized protein YsxB (DUF464 family)